MKTSSRGKTAIKVETPIDDREIERLKIGDQIEINGLIYCGRDAVLPKLVRLFEAHSLERVGVKLEGVVIFHTAVSPAGIGPTSSNKVEIEGSIPALSRAGVKIHLGKGSLSPKTVKELKKSNSVFAITPPVSALLSDKVVSQRVAAFSEEGMEALFQIEVKGFPAIIAIAHGETLYESSRARRGGGDA